MTALLPSGIQIFSPLNQSFRSSSADSSTPGSRAKSSSPSDTSSFTRLAKRRAVDDDDTRSSDINSVSHKRRRISKETITLNKFVDQIATFNAILRRELDRSHWTGDRTSERLARAHNQLEELTLLDSSPDALVAMHDLFNTDVAAMEIFLSIKEEDIRSRWVKQQVKSLGYII
jgi:hypothetical protein